MLALRPGCEHCGKDLPPDSDAARICSFECTFCIDCATWELLGICPNCGGELVTRPRRPVEKLAKSPASSEVVRKVHDIPVHQATVFARLGKNELPPQTWVVSFANERMPDDDGYGEMGDRMDVLASQQPGYVGIDSVRGSDGVGITVSRWSSIAAMVAWRRLGAHAEAQRRGRSDWYRSYRSDVARVDRTASFERE
jgi:uncharacterized protein